MWEIKLYCLVWVIKFHFQGQLQTCLVHISYYSIWNRKQFINLIRLHEYYIEIKIMERCFHSYIVIHSWLLSWSRLWNSTFIYKNIILKSRFWDFFHSNPWHEYHLKDKIIGLCFHSHPLHEYHLKAKIAELFFQSYPLHECHPKVNIVELCFHRHPFHGCHLISQYCGTLFCQF